MAIIEDTFCEAFEGLVVQLMVTAQDELFLTRAVNSFTALPSTVFGDAEGGIVKWLSKEESIDNRIGAIVQLWVTGTNSKAKEKFYEQLGRRLRQGILVVPTTSVFDAYPHDVDTHFNLMNNVGHCGDGYEKVIKKYDRELISVPIMMGHDFLIEERIKYAKGIMGGNLWLFCDSVESGIEIGREAVQIINTIDNVCTTFDVCSAGSKPETKFPEIGPSTNHPFCPTLRETLPSSEFKVPERVKSIPEIIFNALDIETVKNTMKEVIRGIIEMEGLIKISAGNYGGKLGKYKIHLRDLRLNEKWFSN
ncbi:MAG: formylmethanofuran--tetrahydromethanopterin N-formyltransferase [Candidatus Lokiarchaeota archaeon]|nr:formylmethanofuran--tetrahydromethanopterin N-formyltransferase [Candidatus Lokiarchaeota archaeon]MBD3343262.1 formylmethanofuran--tetrahydromethanopterin N-formyltransferase [Candidatus Lokiarchaeota archaeon]